MTELNGDRAAWLRCYPFWSPSLEIQIPYDAIRRVDPDTGVLAEGVDEVQESVVQCLDCMHDQPHLTFQDDRVVAIEDRWQRMVAGTPWVASCTVRVDQDRVETCSGPEAIEFLTYGAFGDAGVREFFALVRCHKHDGEQIVVHLLVELYARSAQEATEVLEEAAHGQLEITSLAEESRPPAHASDEAPRASAGRQHAPAELRRRRVGIALRAHREDAEDVSAGLQASVAAGRLAGGVRASIQLAAKAVSGRFGGEGERGPAGVRAGGGMAAERRPWRLARPG